MICTYVRKANPCCLSKNKSQNRHYFVLIISSLVFYDKRKNGHAQEFPERDGVLAVPGRQWSPYTSNPQDSIYTPSGGDFFRIWYARQTKRVRTTPSYSYVPITISPTTKLFPTPYHWRRVCSPQVFGELVSLIGSRRYIISIIVVRVSVTWYIYI